MFSRFSLLLACVLASLAAPALADGNRGQATQTLVLEREHIEQMPARNLADVIDTVAGVQIQRAYGLGDSAIVGNHYGVGGFGAQQPLVLLNGRRLDFSHGGIQGLNSIALQSVERVEILPFTGAALYGQGAKGAVVNVITRTAKQDQDAAQITLEGGSYHTRKGSLWASTHQGNTGLFSAAEINASRGYRHDNDLRQHKGYIDLRHQLDQSTLYLSFHGNSETLDTVGALPTTTHNPKTQGNNLGVHKRDTFQLMPGVVWHFAHADAYLEGSVFGYDREQLDITQARYREVETKGYSVTPRLAGRLNTGPLHHDWTLGWDLYQVRYQDKSQPLTMRAEHNQAGVYGQLRTQFTPWLAATMAARHEKVRQQDWQGNGYESQEVAQYEGGVEFQLAEPLSLAFDAARTEEVAPLLLGAQPQLTAETGRLYSVTLAWRHQRQHSAISYWYGEREHALFYDAANNTMDNWDDKIGHSGFSLNSRWRLDKGVWLTLNASFQKATFKEGVYKGNVVPNAPRRTGYAQLNWRALEWLDIAFAQRYYGTRFYANDPAQQYPRQRGYNWSDITATARWQRLDFTVGVYNLQDRNAYDVGFVDINNDTQRYPLPGRHVMIGVSATL